MKPEEERKMRTTMGTLKGARVHIQRKEQHFAVEIGVQSEEAKTGGECVIPKKIVTNWWATAGKMNVDEG